MSHFGYMQTISNFEELGKETDGMQRHLDTLNGNESWMGVSSKHLPIIPYL
jgi:ubiquitin conjugation factor E4 B